MSPFIRLGPLTFQAHEFILLVAFWIGLTLAEHTARRKGLPMNAVNNLGFNALLAFLLGARLGYVLQYWSIYRADPAAMVALTTNSLSPLPGLMAAFGISFWYVRRQQVANRLLLDALTPGFIILAVGVSLADLASGDGYGSPAQLPWSIYLWGAARHPVQIYQMLAAILIGAILWWRPGSFDGAQFGWFIALYTASRLFLETFHGDSAFIDGIRVVQVWSLLAFLGMLLLLRYWDRMHTRSLSKG